MKNNLLILFIFVLFPSLIYSLEELPQWVEFQQAKRFYENGEFQKSLDYFLEVTKSETPYPEAEFMIGLLYLEEGELNIAQEQILKAINLSIYLQVPEDLLSFKYELANVYLLKNDYENYVLTLNDIIGVEDINLNDVRDQKAYFETLIESGIDRLLHLYRKKADNVLNARVLLGYYYNSIGEYKESVNYLISPMIGLITEVINDNIVIDREYVFQSMKTFLNEVSNNRRSLEYFVRYDFYKLLYYLGESLYGLGSVERAEEIWELLSNSGEESLWSNKAKKQLLNPTLEEWKFIY